MSDVSLVFSITNANIEPVALRGMSHFTISTYRVFKKLGLKYSIIVLLCSLLQCTGEEYDRQLRTAMLFLLALGFWVIARQHLFP